MTSNERLSSRYSNEQVQALMDAFALTATPVAAMKPDLEQLMDWAHHRNPDPELLNLLLGGMARIERFEHGEPVVTLTGAAGSLLQRALVRRRRALSGNTGVAPADPEASQAAPPPVEATLFDMEAPTPVDDARLSDGMDHWGRSLTENLTRLDYLALLHAFQRGRPEGVVTESDFRRARAWACNAMVGRLLLDMLLSGLLVVREFGEEGPVLKLTDEGERFADLAPGALPHEASQ
jgi:hypothetical protein